MIHDEYIDFKRGVDFMFFMIFYYFTQAFSRWQPFFIFVKKNTFCVSNQHKYNFFAQKTLKRADTLRKQVNENLLFLKKKRYFKCFTKTGMMFVFVFFLRLFHFALEINVYFE